MRAAISLDERFEHARRHLRTALAWEGCEILEIPPDKLGTRLDELTGCTALVYDLSPGTVMAVSTIRDCWLRFPDLPILLYVPPAPHVGPILTAIREIPAAIEMQLDTPAEPRRLQLILRDLFAKAANAGFRQLLWEVVEQMPTSVKRLVEQRIRSLEMQPHALPALPRMSSLAARVGVTLRRLEQVSRTANLPAPKDILDYVTLLWLSFSARRRRVSTAAFAREVGVSSERLYRLRRRLITPRSKMRMQDPSTELVTIFRSLAHACHMSIENSRTRLGIPARTPTWEPIGNLAPDHADDLSQAHRSLVPPPRQTEADISPR